jgi:uncharacterized Rossmann fold enzyme
MDWDRWSPWYTKIISDFGYDPSKDMGSAKLLNRLLKEHSEKPDLEDLRAKIQGKIVIIYGCGPSLENQLNDLVQSNLDLSHYVHIAADGATTALLKMGITPQVIVSDLDGRIEDLVAASRRGSLLIIHAHGDNIDKIKQYFARFTHKIIGTTQNEPLSYVWNFGGFTDGDRCVFLAEEMGASIILLVGFDFGKIIGKFSKPHLEKNVTASENKFKKLQWARVLISELSLRGKSRIIKLNGNKLEVGKVTRYSLPELIDFLVNYEANPKILESSDQD